MIKYIFFDLDGTLTDPGIGITGGVMNALRKFNIEIPPRTELYKFIGPPLRDSFMEYYGMSEEDAQTAISYYREYYAVTGIFENDVYPGIPELLAKLKDDGYILSLATSKPELFAIKILKHYDLYQYFDYVAGASMDEKLVKKGDIIEYAIRELKIDDRSQILMIGDRKHDVFGAKECGIDSLGVLYGYGDLTELTDAGASYIASGVADIYPLIAEANTSC